MAADDRPLKLQGRQEPSPRRALACFDTNVPRLRKQEDVVMRTQAVRFLTALLFVLTGAAAQATVLPAQGGPGGGGFNATCPAGQFLVGVSVRSGAWVDAIAPLCAPFLANQGKFGKWQRGQRHGGTGGSPPRDGACPSDRYVSSMQFGFTLDGDTRKIKFVDFVQITCTPVGFDTREPTTVCLETGDGCKGRSFGSIGSGFTVLPPFDQNCPGLEAATGIHGRSGVYVDALGLICGSKPSMVAPAKPKPIKKLGKAKPPPEPIKRLGKAAAVIADVDVYSAPGGNGNVLGVLGAGQTVTLLSRPCPDNWCNVSGNAVPSGKGWVYNGPDYRSLRF